MSRLVKMAPPSTLVITEEAAAMLEPDGWVLEELKLAPLRGMEHQVRAFVARVGGSGPS